MHASPKISIVLATYNGETYLAEQLQSLVNQTYPNFDIIAIDDGSTDDTVNILYQFALQHSNIKVYINETNLGFIKNFEKGCSLATGDLKSSRLGWSCLLCFRSAQPLPAEIREEQFS